MHPKTSQAARLTHMPPMHPQNPTGSWPWAAAPPAWLQKQALPTTAMHAVPVMTPPPSPAARQLQSSCGCGSYGGYGYAPSSCGYGSYGVYTQQRGGVEWVEVEGELAFAVAPLAGRCNLQLPQAIDMALLPPAAGDVVLLHASCACAACCAPAVAVAPLACHCILLLPQAMDMAQLPGAAGEVPLHASCV